MMIRPLAALLLLLSLLVPSFASAEPGRLERHTGFPSKHVDPRNITVWLPADYDPEGEPYAVLYMHDGQNIFEPGSSYGGEEWGVDEAMAKLIGEDAVRRTIVVGIWNTPKRLREYVPAKAFDRLPPEYLDRVKALYGGTPLSDEYLKFIVEELKPFIDQRYNVSAARDDTAIMGSSMGGLISLYALTEYPDVFGMAGAVSTHWPLLLPPEGEALSDADVNAVATAFEGYLASALPEPGGHRIWFDHGDETLDAHYAAYQARIDALMEREGWVRGRDWISKNFPGAAHNEASWRARVDQPLRFLLPPSQKAP